MGWEHVWVAIPSFTLWYHALAVVQRAECCTQWRERGITLHTWNRQAILYYSDKSFTSLISKVMQEQTQVELNSQGLASALYFCFTVFSVWCCQDYSICSGRCSCTSYCTSHTKRLLACVKQIIQRPIARGAQCYQALNVMVPSHQSYKGIRLTVARRRDIACIDSGFCSHCNSTVPSADSQMHKLFINRFVD